MKRSPLNPTLLLSLLLIASGSGPVGADAAKDERKAEPEAPFESEIRAFEAADKTDPPPPGGVVFVGSSSIRMWTTLTEDFPTLNVINRGFGGSQIADSTRYAGRIVVPYKPRTIVLYAGDNDIAAGKSPKQVSEDFAAFVAAVRKELPETLVLFIAIKPSVARWHLVEQIREANRLIAAAAAKDDSLGYIDVFTPMLGADGKPRPELLVDDGLHLSRKGYLLWTEVVGRALDRSAPPAE